MDTLRCIVNDEPVSPRTLRAELPRDLASICLKCLEKEPARRYATAGELAADLRRFLAGEAVTARLPTRAERLLKWCRRRPAAAALFLVSGIAAMLLLTTLLWHQVTIEAQNVELQKALQNAKDQRLIAARKSDEVADSAYATQIRVVADLFREGQGGRMADLLNYLRPSSGERDRREFAWHYLWRTARNEQWLRGHSDSVSCMAFSKDGRSFASTDENSIILWDVATGQQRMSLRGFKSAPRSIAFSPDGRKIAAGNPHVWKYEPMEVRVWDVTTGELVASFVNPGALQGEPAFSPDSNTLALPRRPESGGAGIVILWNAETNSNRSVLTELDSKSACHAVAFAPDGKTLAVAYGPDFRRCQLIETDVATGQKKRPFLGDATKCSMLRYAPDGHTLYSWGVEDTLRMWDVATGKERMNLQASDSRVPHAVLSEDGRILVTLTTETPGFDSNRITLRDAATGKVLGDPLEPSLRVFSVGLSPDGKTVAIGLGDTKIHLMRPKPLPAFHAMSAHTKEAWGVAFAPDSKTIATASDDHFVKSWRVTEEGISAAPLQVLEGHDSLVSCLAHSRDGKLLVTGSYDKTAKLWDVARGSLRWTMVGHEKPIRHVAISANGSLVATGSADKTVRLWEVSTGRPMSVVGGHENTVRAVAFSPTDGRLASAGEDRALIVWNVEPDLQGQNLTVNLANRVIDQAEIWSASYSPDGSILATAGADGIPKLWDKDLRGHRPVIGAHQGGIKCLAFAPDGKVLATGGEDKTVRLWHVATGQELLCFKDPSHTVNAVAFSSNGRSLVAALHDGVVMLWQAKTQ